MWLCWRLLSHVRRLLLLWRLRWLLLLLKRHCRRARFLHLGWLWSWRAPGQNTLLLLAHGTRRWHDRPLLLLLLRALVRMGLFVLLLWALVRIDLLLLLLLLRTLMRVSLLLLLVRMSRDWRCSIILLRLSRRMKRRRRLGRLRSLLMRGWSRCRPLLGLLLLMSRRRESVLRCTCSW